jgi:hypothetical protein
MPGLTGCSESAGPRGASMNASHLAGLTQALAAERLEPYRRDGVDPRIGLARYLLNLALCEALYSPLHLAEVTLRNRLHRALSLRYGDENWFDSVSLRLLPWQATTLLEARRRLRDSGKPATAGRIVAELPFGFWSGFFNKAHARTGVGFHLAKHAFTHAPSSGRDLAGLDRRWEEVRSLRNRVFHHERIVHFADLDGQHARLHELIAWMSPEVHALAAALDRFAATRREGLTPWLARLLPSGQPAP